MSLALMTISFMALSGVDTSRNILISKCFEMRSHVVDFHQ